MSSSINIYKAYLSTKLVAGAATTTIDVDRMTAINGEAIVTADFSDFARGIITINPDGDGRASTPEFISFTGISGSSFTGATRGLSAKSNTSSTNRMYFFPVGTPVVISFGVHNLLDLVAYIDAAVAGEIGTADDMTAGSTKLTEDLDTHARAMAALVHQQDTPDMTLAVEPFSTAIEDFAVAYAGGNTATIVAPVTNPRIDLIVYATATSAIAVRGGSEGVSPSVPTPTAGDIVLAEVYLRVGQTVIRDRDSLASRSYIRRWYQPNIYGRLISTTTGAGDAGKPIKTGSDGQIDLSLVRKHIKFGGTGADGALTITSGATNIDLGSAAVLVKNYTSISITGTGSITFTNPNDNGTVIILKSQGNVTITSSANPTIDIRSLGGLAGSGSNANEGSPKSARAGGGGASSINDGEAGGGTILNSCTGGNGGSPGIGSGRAEQGYGGASTAAESILYNKSGSGVGGFAPHSSGIISAKFLPLTPGGGGGGGGTASDGGGTAGNGGRGAGALYIECGGALNISSVINGAGTAGTSTGGSPSGGGGGGGGTIIILYVTLTANTGTYTVTGGAAGIGGTNSGGAGGLGYSLVAFNTEFA